MYDLCVSVSAVGAAAFLADEARDDVKTMNSYAEYAKTVTIRDKQLAEKREREAREAEQEKIRCAEMEIARLEQVKVRARA